jgi:hypothetical protein
MSDETTLLYRPVGKEELAQIADSGWKAFPPRSADQPIFYPMASEEFAQRVAREWSTRDPRCGYVGYVVRYRVKTAFLKRFEFRAVGSKEVEYWVPAKDLATFNANIVGEIECVGEYRDDHGSAGSPG